MSYRSSTNSTSSSRYRINGYRSQPVSNRTSLYATPDVGATGDISDFDRQFKRLLERTEKFTNRVERLQNTASHLKRGFRDIDRTASGRVARDTQLSTFDSLIDPNPESTEQQWKRYIDLGILIEKAVEFLRMQKRHPKPVFEYSPESRSPYSYDVSPGTKLVSNPRSPDNLRDGKKKTSDVASQKRFKDAPDKSNNDTLSQNDEKLRISSGRKDKLLPLSEVDELPPDKAINVNHSRFTAKDPVGYQSKENYPLLPHKRCQSKESKDENALAITKTDSPKSSPKIEGELSSLSNAKSSDVSSVIDNSKSQENIKYKFRSKGKCAASKARPSTVYIEDQSTKDKSGDNIDISDGLSKSNKEKDKPSLADSSLNETNLKCEKKLSKSPSQSSIYALLDDTNLNIPKSNSSSSRSSFHEYIPGHRVPLKERLRLKQLEQSKQTAGSHSQSDTTLHSKPTHSLAQRASKIIRAKYHGKDSNDDKLFADHKIEHSKTPSFKSRFLRKLKGTDKDAKDEHTVNTVKTEGDFKDGNDTTKDSPLNTNVEKSEQERIDLNSSKQGFVNPSFDDQMRDAPKKNDDGGTSTHINKEITKLEVSPNNGENVTNLCTKNNNEQKNKVDDPSNTNVQQSPVLLRKGRKKHLKSSERKSISSKPDDVKVSNLNRKSVLIYEEDIIPTKSRKEKMIIAFRSPKRSREEIVEDDVTATTIKTKVVPEDIFDVLKPREEQIIDEEVAVSFISKKKDVEIDDIIFDKMHEMLLPEPLVTTHDKNPTNRQNNITTSIELTEPKSDKIPTNQQDNVATSIKPTEPESDKISTNRQNNVIASIEPMGLENDKMPTNYQNSVTTSIKSTETESDKMPTNWQNLIEPTEPIPTNQQNNVTASIDPMEPESYKIPTNRQNNVTASIESVEPDSDKMTTTQQNNVATSIESTEPETDKMPTNYHNNITALIEPTELENDKILMKQQTNVTASIEPMEPESDKIPTNYHDNITALIEATALESGKILANRQNNVTASIKPMEPESDIMPTNCHNNITALIEPTELDSDKILTKQQNNVTASIEPMEPESDKIPTNDHDNITALIEPTELESDKILTKQQNNVTASIEPMEPESNKIPTNDHDNVNASIEPMEPESDKMSIKYQEAISTVHSLTHDQPQLLNERKSQDTKGSIYTNKGILSETTMTTGRKMTYTYASKHRHAISSKSCRSKSLTEDQTNTKQSFQLFSNRQRAKTFVEKTSLCSYEKCTKVNTMPIEFSSTDNHKKVTKTYFEGPLENGKTFITENNKMETTYEQHDLANSNVMEISAMDISKKSNISDTTDEESMQYNDMLSHTPVSVPTSPSPTFDLSTDSSGKVTPTRKRLSYFEKRQLHKGLLENNESVGLSPTMMKFLQDTQNNNTQSETKGEFNDAKSSDGSIIGVNIEEEIDTSGANVLPNIQTLSKSEEYKTLQITGTNQVNSITSNQTIESSHYQASSSSNDTAITTISDNNTGVELINTSQNIETVQNTSSKDISEAQNKRSIERSRSQSSFSSSGQSAISSGRNSDDEESRKRRGSKSLFEKQMSIKEYRLKKKLQSSASEVSFSDEDREVRLSEIELSMLSSLGESSMSQDGNLKERNKRYTHNRSKNNNTRTSGFYSSSSESEAALNTARTMNNNKNNPSAYVQQNTRNIDTINGSTSNEITSIYKKPIERQWHSSNDEVFFANDRRKKYSKRSNFKSVENF